MTNLSTLPNLLPLQQWLEALTSGQYDQCHEEIACFISAQDTCAYCTLGLLFHLTGFMDGLTLNYSQAHQFTGLPAEKISYNAMLHRLLNVPATDTDQLVPLIIDLNDRRRLPFPAIAEFILDHPPFLPLLQDISLTCANL